MSAPSTLYRSSRAEQPIAYDALYPVSFARGAHGAGAAVYLDDSAVQKMAEFFQEKGLAALKRQDGAEIWYSDWIEYQGRHGLYASVLNPGTSPEGAAA